LKPIWGKGGGRRSKSMSRVDPQLPISKSSYILFLGSGCSASVPELGCVLRGPCSICSDGLSNSKSKNNRLNPSLLIQCKQANRENNILVDCGKTFREAALRWFRSNNVSGLDAVILTHDHADALGGLDDIRDVQRSGHSLPVFASEKTHHTLCGKYPYLFSAISSDSAQVGRRIANLQPRIISAQEPFLTGHLQITPLELLHGGSYICFGFAFGLPDLVVYLSDFHEIPEKTFSFLAGKKISILVLDMLREQSHPSHPTFDQSVAVSRRFISECKVGHIYFVGLNHTMDHEITNEKLHKLFENSGTVVELAYDGLKVPVDFGDPIT